MTYIIPFSQIEKSRIATAGGKGANLGELTAAGFPVPHGFVLTTVAYDEFVKTHNLQQQIVELARAVSADVPQSSEETSQKIKQLFVEADVPAEIVAAVTTAYQELGGMPVAVRSSATAEDLPTASFAGQQDTFLNVQGQDALLEAIKNCWASLWTARAITYRIRQGIDPEAVSLAVVVQEMIVAEAAGILFTANPLNGDRDQLVINATWGLGEAIVGGQVTPDTVVVDKATGAVISTEIASKTMMTVLTARGTEEQVVPGDKRNRAVLEEQTAADLAQLGAKIEAHYQRPMDIEWAIAAEEIFITQARPITTLPPPPLKDVTWESPIPDSIWMRRQIVEHMPEPLSPLFADLYVAQGLAQSAGALFDMMTRVAGVEIRFDKFMPYGFATTINGFGYTTANYNVSPKMLMVYARLRRLLKQPELDWEGTVLPGYQAQIDRWGSLDLQTATDDQLLAGIRELSAADSAYWFGSMLNLIFSRSVDTLFDKLLKSFLVRSALPKPGLGSSAFLRGFDSRALDAQSYLESLAQTVSQSAGMRELVLKTPAADLLSTLANHPQGQPVLAGIHHYLGEYGHQFYNLDYVTPTQSEDPLPILLSFRELVKSPLEIDTRMRQEQMAAGREALVEQTAAALNPISRRLFRWAWKWTKRYAPYREEIMFYVGAAWPTVRKLAAELGARLTAADIIANPADIYYLNSGEIATAIKSQAEVLDVPNHEQTVQARRDLRDARMKLTPLPKVPEQSAIKMGPFRLKMLEPTPQEVVAQGATLDGFPVSTGRVVAPASVIHDAADFDQMRPNTILVCTTTTPAWTPLLSQAAGLVTDVGGALAHGSIVAREYGIPAVMGTGVATKRIQSGMMLELDGDAGTVTLLDENGIDPKEPLEALEQV